MPIFEKTAAEQKRIDEFLENAENAIKTLEPYSECVNIGELRRVCDNFRSKINDFYSGDRKLNIGVIGQVKAGKSTFLNTLLFDGKDVLPSAKTPKTATLTKIEYSETNSITVEYYKSDEWDILKEYSKSDIADNEHEVAREIMKLVNENGLDADEYIEKGNDTIEFESADELMGRLNEYVGENGKITPFVKNVVIHLNRPELKEISVVDTPGLNDAIASRTDKTREFMEKCDVVFFLSRSSQFLDATDMKLITAQLPQKGVENLILISSRFDEGLLDELKKTGSLSGTIEKVKSRLTKHAEDIVKQKQSDGIDRNNLFEQCKTPIFMSSIAYNMSKKSQEDYNKVEQFCFKKLNRFNEVNKEILKEIGNIDCIQAEFAKIVNTKDSTLQSKAKQFIPKVKSEWSENVHSLCSEARNTLQLLETGDRESIKKQKNLVLSQISGIKASLETVLGELLLSLESHKTDCLRKLRENCRDSSHIEERQGTEWHTSTHKVTTGHLWWKKSHYEVSNYSTTYTYLAASDALENVRNFGLDACSDIESSFQKAVDVKNVKRRLMQTILDNFDSTDESFDANYFRHITESTLNQLEFPIIKINIEPFLEKISAKFSGEVRNSGERSELQNILADSIDKLYNAVTDIFTSEISSFKSEINKIKENFADILLTNINDEFEKLQNQFDNKEKMIQRYIEVIELLSKS